MTIPSNVARNDYTGTGITGPYPVTFKFFENADLKVTVADANGVETVKTLTTDYTVTGAGEQSGGSITFTTAVASGYSIAIEPKYDGTQDTDIKNQGGNLRESLEDRFDRQCRDLQVVKNDVDRSVKVQTTDAESVDPVLPPRQAGALIGWNEDGSGFSNRYGPSDIADDATVIATGSTTARWISDRFGEVANVKDFGAVGDGVTDDTAAIQAAITHATANLKKVVFPTNGASQYYKVTAPLVCTGPVSIIGDGPNQVTIIASGLSTGQYIVDFNLSAASNYWVEVSGITLRATGTPNGIRLKNCSYAKLDRVVLYDLANGVDISGTICFSNEFSGVHGLYIGESTVRFLSFNGGGHFLFSACTFAGPTGFNVDSSSVISQMMMSACNFEQCSQYSLLVSGTVQGFAIVGCRTEGADVNDFVFYPTAGNEVNGLVISGCYFTSDGGAIYPIQLGGGGGIVRGFSITGNHVEYEGATSFVKLNGDGESGTVSGNYFNLNTTIPVDVRRNGVVVFGNENALGKCAESWGAADWGVAQGTWTPVDASGAALTFASASGEYTKVGRYVHWKAYVLYPATADASNASIGGLPYNAGATVTDRAGIAMMSDAGTVSGLHGTASATSFSLFNSTTFAAITNATMSGKQIYASGMYKV